MCDQNVSMATALNLIFTEDGLLSPGDVELTIAELRSSVLVTGPGAAHPGWDAAWRAKLVDNLEVMVRQLWAIGITEVFIDGSFVEDKSRSRRKTSYDPQRNGISGRGKADSGRA
jgi:hypothetical protein